MDVNNVPSNIASVYMFFRSYNVITRTCIRYRDNLVALPNLTKIKTVLIVQNNHNHDIFKWLWCTMKCSLINHHCCLKYFQISLNGPFQIRTTQFIVRFSNATQNTILANLQIYIMKWIMILHSFKTYFSFQWNNAMWLLVIILATVNNFVVFVEFCDS